MATLAMTGKLTSRLASVGVVGEANRRVPLMKKLSAGCRFWFFRVSNTQYTCLWIDDTPAHRCLASKGTMLTRDVLAEVEVHGCHGAYPTLQPAGRQRLPVPDVSVVRG